MEGLSEPPVLRPDIILDCSLFPPGKDSKAGRYMNRSAIIQGTPHFLDRPP